MVDHGDIQAALSARIDGEDSHLDDDIVDAHLAELSLIHISEPTRRS